MDPSGGFRKTIALRMLGTGVRMRPDRDEWQGWPSSPVLSLWQLEALLGRGGCGGARLVFLCRGRTDTGSSCLEFCRQARVCLRARGSLRCSAQLVGGGSCCLCSLCRHGLVAGDISGGSLGFGQALNPTLVLFHQLVRSQQYVRVLLNLALLV